jgi:hypothetical protein
MESAGLTDETVSLPGELSETNELLRALLAVTGRVAFPEERLRAILSPTSNTAYLAAYRLCDGKTALTAIAKAVGVDHSNLSKTISKWIELGVAFRAGPKRLPLHLYALPTDDAKPPAPRKSRPSARATSGDGRRIETPVDVPATDDESTSGLDASRLQLGAE